MHHSTSEAQRIASLFSEKVLNDKELWAMDIKSLDFIRETIKSHHKFPYHKGFDLI